MSAQGISIFSLTTIAAGVTSASTFIGWNGQTCAAGATAQGIGLYDAAVGDALTVDVLGTAPVLTGGVFAFGALLEVGANGTAIAHNTGTVVARALQASTAAGQIVEVMLLPASS